MTWDRTRCSRCGGTGRVRVERFRKIWRSRASGRRVRVVTYKIEIDCPVCDGVGHVTGKSDES